MELLWIHYLLKSLMELMVFAMIVPRQLMGITIQDVIQSGAHVAKAKL